MTHHKGGMFTGFTMRPAKKSKGEQNTQKHKTPHDGCINCQGCSLHHTSNVGVKQNDGTHTHPNKAKETRKSEQCEAKGVFDQNAYENTNGNHAENSKSQ